MNQVILETQSILLSDTLGFLILQILLLQFYDIAVK